MQIWSIIGELWHDPVFSGWAWVASVVIIAYMRVNHKARLKERQAETERWVTEVLDLRDRNARLEDRFERIMDANLKSSNSNEKKDKHD